MSARSALLSSLVILAAGCQDPAPIAESSDNRTIANPAAAPPETTHAPPDAVAAEPPSVSVEEPVAHPLPESTTAQIPPRHLPDRPAPKRPEDSWVIWREVFDPKEDASCEPVWLGDNKFDVTTKNLRRVTLDLTRLPEGAPSKGPWIVYMDGQGIEMTGFKPKRGFTGRKRDLIRSKNGYWTVDKKKLYRAGG